MPVLNKIDLPSAEPDRVDRGDRGHHRHRRTTRCAPAPRPARASTTSSRRSSRASRRRKGDPDAPLQALIFDSWFDNYVGVVMLVRVMEGTLKPQRQDPADGDRRDYNCEQVGVFTPKAVARDELSAGEVGFVIAGIKEIDAAQGRRHRHRSRRVPPPRRCPASRRSSRRCSPASIRSKSNQYEALRDALEKLQAERRVASLRAGGLAGARLRLPLRLPRPAAHGDRAGAARARVRHGPDHDRADGRLPGAAARRRRCSRSTTRRSCPTVAHRGDPRADHHGDDPHAAGVRRPGDHAVQREARRAEEHAVPRPPGDADLRPAARRGRDGLLRQAEVGLARLRVARLRVQGVPRRPTSCKLDILVNGERVDALSVIVHRVGALVPRPRAGDARCGS